MSHHPRHWHTAPAAQALIGLIAASGIEPTNRPYRNALSADYAPHYIDNLVYDCPEFEQLAGLQQQALTDALNACHATAEGGKPGSATYDDFGYLAAQNLGELVAAEIAARRQAVAA